MNVAVVFNETSHLPSTQLADTGKKIKGIFPDANFIICKGYGHAYIEGAKVLELVYEPDYKQRIANMVQALLDENPQYLVSVGGDGLASYIASTVSQVAGHVILLGIAAGTANVGPIVSFSQKELSSLSLADLEVVEINGIEVSDESGYLGVGFNDVIIGNTFLGTEDNKCCNLSVEALVKNGERKSITVGTQIITDRFSLRLNGIEKQLFPELSIAQIVVTTLQFDKLYGRAIFGGLCLGREACNLAAVGLSTRNMVNCSPDAWDSSNLTAIQHLVFSSSSDVVLEGLGKDAHIVIDGNPFLRNGTVCFRLRPGIVRALKQSRKGEVS